MQGLDLNRRSMLRASAALTAGCLVPSLAADDTGTSKVPGLDFVRIETGRFQMGNRGFPISDEDPAPHLVTISRPFELATTTVTQEVYCWLMGEEANPSHFRKDKARPVESITWIDAIRFCNALSERVGLKPAFQIDGEQVRGLPSPGFRLPLESEWEYACRAGTTTLFSSGDSESTLSKVACFGLGLAGSTQPVRTKEPNAWGLFDMHGNINEWCWDWFGPAPRAASARTPSGPTSGVFRVIRGGSYIPGPLGLRSSFRGRAIPATRARTIGFRLARSL
jgi:formylglycine-generating enzyme required for sulfatase activity